MATINNPVSVGGSGGGGGGGVHGNTRNIKVGALDDGITTGTLVGLEYWNVHNVTGALPNMSGLVSGNLVSGTLKIKQIGGDNSSRFVAVYCLKNGSNYINMMAFGTIGPNDFHMTWTFSTCPHYTSGSTTYPYVLDVEMLTDTRGVIFYSYSGSVYGLGFNYNPVGNAYTSSSTSYTFYSPGEAYIDKQTLSACRVDDAHFVVTYSKPASSPQAPQIRYMTLDASNYNLTSKTESNYNLGNLTGLTNVKSVITENGYSVSACIDDRNSTTRMLAYLQVYSISSSGVTWEKKYDLGHDYSITGAVAVGNTVIIHGYTHSYAVDISDNGTATVRVIPGGYDIGKYNPVLVANDCVATWPDKKNDPSYTYSGDGTFLALSDIEDMDPGEMPIGKYGEYLVSCTYPTNSLGYVFKFRQMKVKKASKMITGIAMEDIPKSLIETGYKGDVAVLTSS